MYSLRKRYSWSYVALLIAASSLGMAVGSTAAENLLLNGSFELGSDPGVGVQLDQGSTVMTGWEVTHGNIDYIGSRWVAYNGGRCIDLSGSIAGTISQTVSGLTAGRRYTLEFQMAANPEAPPAITSLRVVANGEEFQFTVSIVGSKTNLLWQPRSCSFVANSDSLAIQFASLNPGWSGPVLDGLSLVAGDLVEPPGPNLLVNGGFELGADVGTELGTGSTKLNGWSVVSGNLDYIGSRWIAFEGSRCIDLSGSIAGTIAQTVAGLTVGKAYRLSFQMAANPEAPPTTTEVMASVGGVSHQFSVNAVGTTRDLLWQFKFLDFVADAESMEVRFASLNPGWAGPVLDGLILLPTEAAPSQVYELSSGFFTSSNPDGPWRLGWKESLGGEMTPFSFNKSFGADNGVRLYSWQLSDSEGPSVCQVFGPGVAMSAGGQFVAPPGTVWMSPGNDGAAQNFGTARFTVPAGAGAVYRLESRAWDVFDGSYQGDTDFHILKNGVEIAGDFLAPHTSFGYTNELTLADGDTVDFVIGRGQDNHQTGSTLKVFARLRSIVSAGSNAPVILSQPADTAALVGQATHLSVTAVGSLPLAYQWFSGDNAVQDATNRTLTLNHVGFSDAGSYHVVVANEFGSVTSRVAALTVKYPAARVQVVSVDAVAYGEVQVPIQLVANGNENALTFSLTYDSVRLHYVSAALGAGADGGHLLNDESQLASGQLGLLVSLPEGQTFAPGTQTVAVVTFTTSGAPSVQRLPVRFGDVPAARLLADVSAVPLDAVYVDGTVSLTPTAVRAGAVNTVTGGAAALPIQMVAVGTENAVSFSLSYNAAILSFDAAQAGPDLPPDASILVNTGQTAQGRVGISVALPAGATFPRGTRDFLRVNFGVATVLSQMTSPVQFVDVPTVRQVANVNAQAMPAVYGTGSVSIVTVALEGDIAPRPDGDRALTVIDWVQAGRFAAALDAVEPGEFQRVDCAPRDTRGNGVISVADWVQAGRYSAGLDPLTGIGGPTEPVAPGEGGGGGVGGGGGGGGGGTGPAQCTVRIPSSNVLPGGTVSVPVQVTASGSENAFGFTLVYDASKLRFVSATKLTAVGTAALNVNTNLAGSGRVGIAFALPTGMVLPAGSQSLLTVTLAAAPAAAGVTSLAFGDGPVLREAVSATAQTVSSSFTPGTIVVGPAVVSGPPLSIVPSSGNVVIYWSAAEPGYELQASEAPAGSSWSNVGVTPLEIGGQKIVTLPGTSSARYFRLRKP